MEIPKINTGAAIDYGRLDNEYALGERLIRFPGVGVLPVCGPLEGEPNSANPTKPQIVSLYTPFGLRIVDWSAERVGSPGALTTFPPLPKSDTGRPDSEVLVRESLEPKAPLRADQGSNIAVRMSGTYIYVTMTPLKADGSDSIPMPKSPLDAFPIQVAPGVRFVSGLIDGQAGGNEPPSGEE